MADGRPDARQVIAQILDDPRVGRDGRASSGRFSQRVYGDEPILMTGRALADALPEQYREARALAHSPQAYRKSSSWLFYQQGRLLAPLEDDALYHGDFVRYFPTYRDLNDRQLRGYVAWRTAVRAGQVAKAPTSFMFLYAYELLNGIGVAGPAEAFDRLRAFWAAHRDQEPKLDRYLRSWLVDLAVYHDLPSDVVAADPLLNCDVVADARVAAVCDPATAWSHEGFDAWVGLSSYRLGNSRFYKACPSDVEAVVLAVLERLDAYYAKNRKADLRTSLFGPWGERPHPMFASAVFYEERPHRDASYQLGLFRRFACSGGAWTCACYPGTRDGARRLGGVLKAIDAAMRRRWEFSHPLKQPATPQYLARMIERAIDERLAWSAAHAPVRVAIDRSKLRGIRAGAARTCEALLVDEERCEGEERTEARDAVSSGGPGAACGSRRLRGAAACGEGISGGAAQGCSKAAVPTCGGGLPDAGGNGSPVLTASERRLVELLLAGKRPDEAASGVVTVDVLVDSVNEKLFDLLGDTAIEFDGAGPVLVEDYRADVEGILEL